MINEDLKKYIEEKIFPEYAKNDLGHNIDHILYVIERSLKFAKENNLDVDLNMVYTIAAYHDIGHHIDAKNHEKVSADILAADVELKKYFDEEQIKIMSDAVYDHRASLTKEGKKPRSIYGEIVSSADRNTLIDVLIKRTYAYRIEHCPDASLDEIIEDSRQHVLDKFCKGGYATTAIFFEDKDYKKFLEDIDILANNNEMFRKRYMEVNGLNNILKLNFDEIRRHNLDMSLDEVLYAVYNSVKDKYNKSFDELREEILRVNGINELEYYTKNVNPKLKIFIDKKVFPDYENNDGGHGYGHILEVIRRSFALNDTEKLGLDDNMMYAIAACHDWGKYEDSDRHNFIAAARFMNEEGFKEFFDDEQRIIIKEAIEDHKSSVKTEIRSVYGKLVSSADRNTTINMVFIRSFFVAHAKNPDMGIEEYLDATIARLSKRYSLDENENENMFFDDITYNEFLHDMRDLLQRPDDFKNRYCEVNHITSRDLAVKDFPGELSFIKVLKK